MKIGIFGGSFNPPHLMHKKIAEELISQGYVEKVIFVPTGGKYPKAHLIEGKYRYEMLKLMIQNHSHLEVSDYEIKSTLIRTFQTLNHFKEKYPNDTIYFICGTDNLKELDTWRNYPYILTNFKLLVIKRNEDDIHKILTKYLDYQDNIIICNLKIDSISSTTIRELFNHKVTSKEIINYLSKEVLQYIYEHHLYQKKERKLMK